jgi:mycothiol system anti-sigma-R factor
MRISMSLIDRLSRLLGYAGSLSHQVTEDGECSRGCKSITCLEALGRVQEYLDGELDGVSHEEVAHHFSVCKACYPHLRLEERFLDLVHRSETGESCPEHLRTQVMALLAAESGDLG